jgi:hypothetical protein
MGIENTKAILVSGLPRADNAALAMTDYDHDKRQKGERQAKQNTRKDLLASPATPSDFVLTQKGNYDKSICFERQ